MANPYYKTTKGYNAEVIVAKSLAYTADANLAAFLANAAEGAIGVFKASDNSLLDGTAAAAAGTEVYIAQKRDGAIHKTTTFKIESGVAKYTNYTAPVKDKWTIDSSGLTVAKGDVFELAIIELSRLTQPYHVWNFEYTAKSGDTITTVVNALAAKINDLKAGENYAYGQIAVATNTADDLILEAKEVGRFFKVALRQKLADAPITHTAKPSIGSGTYEGIKQLEYEGAIFAGFTTNYPNQNILPEEFGKPTAFAERGVTYDVVMLTVWAREESPLPMHKHDHKKYIVLAIPSGGTTPKTELKKIFGF